MKKRLELVALGGLAAAIVVGTAPIAIAHVHDHFAGVNITIGWATEPAFVGEPNSPQLVLTQGGGEDHTHTEEAESPVAPEQVALTVEIIFGDKDGTDKTEPLALVASPSGTPGEWTTDPMVPTRPGNYTFHVAGTLAGEDFDKFFTSGSEGAIDGTEFEDVRETSSVAFPEADPSNRDLAEALDRIEGQSEEAAASASDLASTARLLGIGGIALGALALLVALVRGGRRKSEA